MTTSSTKRFFDLHVTGLGYLNRVREVTPARGAPFLACDISALNGPSDKPQYCRFDVKVSGSAAQHLIRRCEEAVKAERKVLIGFRLGDLWTDLFTYRKGEKAGKPGVSLKARLLYVSWIKIDGEYFYSAKEADEAADDEGTAASAPAFNDAPETEAAPALAQAS